MKASCLDDSNRGTMARLPFPCGALAREHHRANVPCVVCSAVDHQDFVVVSGTGHSGPERSLPPRKKVQIDCDIEAVACRVNIGNQRTKDGYAEINLFRHLAIG